MNHTRNPQTIVGAALLGVGFLLFVAPLVYVEFTNRQADAKTDRIRESIQQEWSTADRLSVGTVESALLYIPAIDVRGVPITEGVDADSLASGVGSYASLDEVGRPGNFALVGHRTAHGEPFADIDQLKAGDIVVVRTMTAIHRFRLLDDVVVTPDQTWVLGDVSRRLGVAPDTPIISLITCSPKWSTAKRWVWWGELIDDRGA